MKKPGSITYIDTTQFNPQAFAVPGYPTIEDLQRLADAIGPFKTKEMELVFADAMRKVMNPPMMCEEK